MDVVSYLLGKNSNSGGADLSEYFNTSISYGASGEGAWLKLIKKLPDNISVSGSNLQYAFNHYYGNEIPFMDTSNVTNMYNTFYYASNITTIPLLDTSNVTSMNSMFSNCINLLSIPLINTSNVTNMSYMFANCNKLIDVPLLNTAKVTEFSGMFNNCNKLTDTSLDNILQMCINASSYTGTKTLATLRINNTGFYPTSRMQSLPHYQDFIDAGWSLGYN